VEDALLLEPDHRAPPLKESHCSRLLEKLKYSFPHESLEKESVENDPGEFG